MSWADLEGAVVDALGALLRPAGPFAAVGTYGGELEEDALATTGGLLPAAFVLVHGGTLHCANTARSLWREDVTVQVLVASRSSAGDQAARRGTPAVLDPGLYALMGSVLATLTDLDFAELPYAALSPVRHRMVVRSRSLTVYGLEFATRRVLDLATLRATSAEDLLRIGIEFDTNGDGEAEASDLVEEAEE